MCRRFNPGPDHLFEMQDSAGNGLFWATGMLPALRCQFGIRTLLVAAMILPPLIAWQYRNWRDNQLWLNLELAKQQRDNALVAWRIAYDTHVAGKSSAPEKTAAAAQERYD